MTAKMPEAERKDQRIAGYVTKADRERIDRLILECGYTGTADVIREAVKMLYHAKGLDRPLTGQ